jgi:hypothetical protein
MSYPKYRDCGACSKPITEVLSDPNLIIQYNLMNAKRWARWLMDSRPNDVIMAPWILLCETLDDTNAEHRARGQRDDDYIIEHCNVDEICCVGGRMSSGMKRDARVGHNTVAADIRDLTHLGTSTPAKPMPELFPTERIVCGADKCFNHWLENGTIFQFGNPCKRCNGTGLQSRVP